MDCTQGNHSWHSFSPHVGLRAVSLIRLEYCCAAAKRLNMLTTGFRNWIIRRITFYNHVKCDGVVGKKDYLRTIKTYSKCHGDVPRCWCMWRQFKWYYRVSFIPTLWSRDVSRLTDSAHFWSRLPSEEVEYTQTSEQRHLWPCATDVHNHNRGVAYSTQETTEPTGLTSLWFLEIVPDTGWRLDEPPGPPDASYRW